MSARPREFLIQYTPRPSPSLAHSLPCALPPSQPASQPVVPSLHSFPPGRKRHQQHVSNRKREGKKTKKNKQGAYLLGDLATLVNKQQVPSVEQEMSAAS